MVCHTDRTGYYQYLSFDCVRQICKKIKAVVFAFLIVGVAAFSVLRMELQKYVDRRRMSWYDIEKNKSRDDITLNDTRKACT